MSKIIISEKKVMRDQISELGRKIYDVLNEKRELNFAQITNFIPASSTEIFHALGWLARNNKIAYQTKGDSTFIRLV